MLTIGQASATACRDYSTIEYSSLFSLCCLSRQAGEKMWQENDIEWSSVRNSRTKPRAGSRVADPISQALAPFKIQ